MGRDRKIRIFVLFMCLGGGLLTVMIGQMPGAEAQAIAQGIAPGPASAYRLVGTVESGPFAGAVLDDSEGGQAFYRLNEKLADESRIVKVQSDHIVLKWPDGTRTELYATQGTAGGGVSVAAPSAPPRRFDRPTPEEKVDRIRNRAARNRTGPSDGTGEGPAGRRPPRMERQNTDQQGAQVRDSKATKGGGKERRGRRRPADDN